MAIKHYLLIFVSLFAYSAMSQNFGALPYLGNGLAPYYLEKLIADTVHDKLILSSRTVNYAGNKKVRGIWSWDGVKWDSLQGGINTHDLLNNQPNGAVLCGIAYNGKFLVGGRFESIGGVNATALATWDGSVWDSLDVRAFRFLDYGGTIYSFANFGGKLYLGGSFDSIQGQKANSLATYDGNTFQAINLPLNNQAAITDMKVYNGELYISGIFTYTGQAGNRHILKYDGNNWLPVGNGIVGGGASNIASMAVYNGELFVGGYFFQAAGNAGNIIMKWNGSSWSDANWGAEFNNGGIWKLVTFKNKLFALGSFLLAGDNTASKIAVYEGGRWCTYADSFDSDISTGAVFRDTLYVGGNFKTITGDTSKRLVAKMLDVSAVDNCNMVGIRSFDIMGLTISPNPFSDKIKLGFEGKNLDQAIIFNGIGDKLLSLSNLRPKDEIDLSMFPNGIYFVRIIQGNNSEVFKLIKSH